jgi:DNA mismatch repair protein MutS
LRKRLLWFELELPKGGDELADEEVVFFEDAEKLAQILNITLTKRANVPMSGFPYHAIDGYLSKLVKSGVKIAICEQMEDPALAKGLVKRDIIRVITPGTVIESSMLADDKNNYICSIYTQDS